jgi:hypothetical protein
MKTVQKAYLALETSCARRVLVDSHGRVFDGGSWSEPGAQVVRTGDEYRTWSDVPSAWIGGSPWWR